MPTIDADVIAKYVAEQYFRTLSYRRRLPAGATITAATVSALDSEGSDATATVLDTTQTTFSVSAETIDYFIKAGAAGEVYTISIQADLSNSQSLVDKVQMTVI
jgi:hypothetical protein